MLGSEADLHCTVAQPGRPQTVPACSAAHLHCAAALRLQCVASCNVCYPAARCGSCCPLELPADHNLPSTGLCSPEWGVNGFANIEMMPDNTYGTCFMYYVSAAC